MELVVFGTSLLWGQGLQDADKIHNVAANMLRQRYTDRKINVTFLAHSGASTGYKPDGSVDMRHETLLNGEVPTLYPTVLQEIDAFNASAIPPESIDVVLLDAGINDVRLDKILDPLATTHEIEKLVEIYCHQHMQLLVEHLLTKFRKATIIIAAYYEFITEESEEGYMHRILKALSKVPGGIIVDVALDLSEKLIKHRLLVNCDTFASKSLAAFRQVAADVNSQLEGYRVFVARPDFKPENATFAADPWLYGINEDLSPQDPLARVRATACRSTPLSRTEPLICERASMGHPNPKGAKAYAEAIVALL